jgi:hypothetical protein
MELARAHTMVHATLFSEFPDISERDLTARST